MSRLISISTLLLLGVGHSIIGQNLDYDSLYLLKNCITLDAKESIDEDRADLIYKWQFGDGEEGSGQVVEHCFDSLGSYNVKLSIIDPSVVSIFQDEWNFEVTITEDYLISFATEQSGLAISCESFLTYDS
ncbi:MAG: PKD domain-containing protein, partial [Crocinitomicaceae bacterium]